MLIRAHSPGKALSMACGASMGQASVRTRQACRRVAKGMAAMQTASDID